MIKSHKKTLMIKIKYTMLFTVFMLSTVFYEGVNSIGYTVFTLHDLVYN